MKWLKIVNSILLWLAVVFIYVQTSKYIIYNEGVTDQLIDSVNHLATRVGRT
jgi:hypothetical protein